MEVNFSEFEEWCTPEITEGECEDQCGECGGEDTSFFLRFICAYMNCEENKHAGKLVATLNKTRLPPPAKMWDYVKRSSETNWARITDNWSLGDRLDKYFNRLWQRKGEFDTLIMLSAMFMHAQRLHASSAQEETYVPCRRTSSATSWGLFAGLLRRVRGGAPYLHHLQTTRRGLVLAL